MINVAEYEYVGKIRLTTKDGKIYIGEALDVTNPEEGPDEPYPDWSLSIGLEGNDWVEIYEKDIASIEVLEPAER